VRAQAGKIHNRAMRQKLLFLFILSLGGCSSEPSLHETPPPASPAVADVAGEAAAAPPESPPPEPAAPGDELVQQALAAIGVSYRRGGESPAAGFDCSGLVVHVYKEALGLSLPHNALAQSKVGRRIDASELKPGDLVFYNTRHRRHSHVGLYLGEGRFVHAPKPGAVVRVERMSAGYWRRRFDGARRIDARDSPVAVR
jgi:cell wall-associated NlpC family hydrolase